MGTNVAPVSMMSTIELQMRYMGEKLADESMELSEEKTLFEQVISHVPSPAGPGEVFACGGVSSVSGE